MNIARVIYLCMVFEVGTGLLAQAAFADPESGDLKSLQAPAEACSAAVFSVDELALFQQVLAEANKETASADAAVKSLEQSGNITAQEADSIRLSLRYAPLFSSGIAYHALAHVLVKQGAQSRKDIHNGIWALAGPLADSEVKKDILLQAVQWISSYLGDQASLKDLLGYGIETRANLVDMSKRQFNDFLIVWKSKILTDPGVAMRALYLSVVTDPTEFAEHTARALPRRRWWIFGERSTLFLDAKVHEWASFSYFREKVAEAYKYRTLSSRFKAYLNAASNLGNLSDENEFFEAVILLIHEAYVVGRITNSQDTLLLEAIRKACAGRRLAAARISAIQKAAQAVVNHPDRNAANKNDITRIVNGLWQPI